MLDSDVSRFGSVRLMRVPRLLFLILYVSAMAVGGSYATASGRSIAADARVSKPVLAFYYSWYHPGTFSSSKMPDLPSHPYESSDPATIHRQVREAAQSGITGFAASWTGPATQENQNLHQLLHYAATYQHQTGTPFSAAIYLETDLLSTYGQTVSGAMSYAINNFMSNPNYFTWHGRPVIFIWDPLGQGRTLAFWTALRRQLDPQHHEIWMVDSSRPYTSWLGAFDGFFVFSALYWCLPPRGLDIGSCDQTFRTALNAYNTAAGTHKIWAAPAQPGYDD